MVRIAAVIGAVTPPGRLSAAVAAANESGVRDGHDVDLIDLASVRLDFADGRPADAHDDDSAAVLGVLARSDAVLLASPVYRASISGALKNLLDLVPVETLRGKPVAVLAVGATAHHYLGVDSHLRDILGWFGALTLPTSVYLQSSDFHDGQPSEEAREKLGELIGALSTVAGAVPREGIGPLPLAAQRAR